MLKDYTFNNNKKINCTKNGKNFLRPIIQSSSVQTSRPCIQGPAFPVCDLIGSYMKTLKQSITPKIQKYLSSYIAFIS